jgi:hypothetical protein
VHKAETVRLYDAKRVLLEDKELAKDDVVDVVVQLRSVQFLQKSFETEWVLHQASLRLSPSRRRRLWIFRIVFLRKSQSQRKRMNFFSK